MFEKEDLYEKYDLLLPSKFDGGYLIVALYEKVKAKEINEQFTIAEIRNILDEISTKYQNVTAQPERLLRILLNYFLRNYIDDPGKYSLTDYAKNMVELLKNKLENPYKNFPLKESFEKYFIIRFKEIKEISDLEGKFGRIFIEGPKKVINDHLEALEDELREAYIQLNAILQSDEEDATVLVRKFAIVFRKFGERATDITNSIASKDRFLRTLRTQVDAFYGSWEEYKQPETIEEQIILAKLKNDWEKASEIYHDIDSFFKTVEWANNVFDSLIKVVSKDDEIVFLAGENYREFLQEKIVDRGNKIACPLYKMSIGEQLQWYSYFTEHKDRIEDLDKFYSLIRKLDKGLNGGLKLRDATGNNGWPEKGVYFFFEEGEFRKTDPFELRVVRVGTHAVSEGSSTTLWNRLRTHRGGIDLGGNHRGSIFRLHVGKSIISKENLDFKTWGIGQNASKEIKDIERKLESQVSEIIGNMKILWLSISDKSSADSDRSFIERNSIALLSCFVRKIDTGSKLWLGNYNPHKSISESSLWNVNYVEDDYDPRFLSILERFVNITLGIEPQVHDSIVPQDWIINRRKKKKQLDLFD